MSLRLCRLAALACGVAVSACGAAPEPSDGPSAVRAGDPIALDAADAGLETVRVDPAQTPEQVEALGRVLDPVPLLQAWATYSGARAEADVAERELARVRALSVHQENASARELEAAEAAAARDRAALQVARAQLAGSWGDAEASAVERWAGALEQGKAAVARIELPAGSPATPPRAIRLSVPGLGLPERRAQLIGAAGSLDALRQGPAFLVALAPDPPLPGAAVVAQVESGEAVARGVVVPASAVVWNAGEPLAFVAIAPNQFARRTLRLAGSVEGGFLATGGISPGELVVRTGAQQLLSSQMLDRRSAD